MKTNTSENALTADREVRRHVAQGESATLTR